jgi:hypothetical protein
MYMLLFIHSKTAAVERKTVFHHWNVIIIFFITNTETVIQIFELLFWGSEMNV